MTDAVIDPAVALQARCMPPWWPTPPSARWSRGAPLRRAGAGGGAPLRRLRILADEDPRCRRGPVREHVFTLAVRSRAGGRKEAQAIAGCIEAVLHTASLPLDGHRLVTLTLVERTSAEGRDRRSFEADLTFRALTEPSA